ncbi:hypothetical protein BDP67DRAFT_500018 [Colletotrichum lupini]|nr:hypothetical protein BDP67DRAFT_500018 [Colletotrichum lupini]
MDNELDSLRRRRTHHRHTFPVQEPRFSSALSSLKDFVTPLFPTAGSRQKEDTELGMSLLRSGESISHENIDPVDHSPANREESDSHQPGGSTEQSSHSASEPQPSVPDAQSENVSINSEADHRLLEAGSTEQPSHSTSESQSSSSESQPDNVSRNSEASHRSPKAKHITRSRWAQYGHGWLIHAPALLMTIAIVVIGSRDFYWYPENGPLIRDYRVDADTISNVLQLVAKIHELLIIASMSSLALAMFRRCLVTQSVGLGFLTGSYRIGDLAYIGSTAFWRQGIDLSNPLGILLPAFVVFATLMSTIVGPASAVLLVPTLAWYNIDASVAFSKVKLPLVYAWNKDNVWLPARLDAPDICDGVEGIYLPYCPAGGYSEISSWLLDYAATDLTNNLTFHSPSADLRRQLIFTQANYTQDTSSVTLCTSPPHFLTGSMGLLQKYIDSSDVGQLSKEPRYRLQTVTRNPSESAPQNESILYQALIQSKCTIHDKDALIEDTNPVYYPVESLNCFGDNLCNKIRAGRPKFGKDWLTDHKYDNQSVSSTFFVRHPNEPIVFIHGQIPDALFGKPKAIIYLCNLHASWIRSNFSVDASFSDALQSSLSNKSLMRDLFHNKSFKDAKTFAFHKRWFEALNPRVNGTFPAVSRLVQNFSSKEKQNGTTLPAMAPSKDNDTAAEIFLAKVFGVYLTEGLSRSTYPYRSTRLVLKNVKDRLEYIDLNQKYGNRGGRHVLTPSNSTGFYQDEWNNHIDTKNGTLEDFTKNELHIHMTAQRHGYGSGQKRPTLLWAQAVMFIYLSVTATYGLCIGCMNLAEFFEIKVGKKPIRVLSIIPWSDLQDLILLALRTPVPEDEDLVDSGAGATSSKVWEKTVWAGADSDLNVHLMFGESKGKERLNLNQEKQYF